MTEQDLRDAFDRMVAAGPPPTGGAADVLAAVREALQAPQPQSNQIGGEQ